MKKAVIAGYGNMGSKYADRIYKGQIEGLSLFGILCRNPKMQDKIRREMPQVKIFPHEDSMFEAAEEFDALIITTPHREHVRMAEKAKAAGLHVLCEKPLGITALECGRVVDGRKRLEEVAEEIVAEIATPQYCKLAEDRGLVLAEQWHMGRTRVDEVLPRLKKTLQPNIERIELAREDRDIDWKAMSHAVRAIRQQEELLSTGTLRYPLACREEILRIKKGECTFAEVEELVRSGLASLEEMRKVSTFVTSPDFERIFAEAKRVRKLCQGQA